MKPHDELPRSPDNQPVTRPRPPAYATMDEAAGYTRLSTRTLRRAVKAGKLARCTVGGRVVVSYAELDRFVLGQPAVPGEVTPG